MLQRLSILAALAAAASGSAHAQCLTTLFASNNSGGTGWALYMDVTAAAPVTVTSLECSFGSTGAAVGVEVYTKTGTYSGFEDDPVAWTLVAMDDGAAISQPSGTPTPVNLLAPFTLQPGTTGVAIVHLGSSPVYTNGTGANQQYTDGVLTVDLGSAYSAPFTPSGTLFSPRVWNGSFCTGASPGIGANFCGPANTNSSGAPGAISASGSVLVASNDLTLTASSLPSNAFGFFIVSQTQGFVANPNGSQGNLCLGGSIGRYVGAGQIKNSGNGGTFDLALDLTMIPQPNGFVSIAAGETWNFQTWFRDFVGGAATSNFTNGLEIDFL